MKLEETRHQRILLSPLNWGFGHVSRCIGLIRSLLSQENEVMIACDETQQAIFKSYFPGLKLIPHAGYPFEFSGKGNFAADLFANRRTLLPRFAREQQEVAKMVADHAIDLVISDQRYGFFSTEVPSVFITHQLHLPLSWYQFPAQWINARLIRNFSTVWCMDTADHRLAGKLSRPIRGVRVDYIGPFSRFEPSAQEKLYEMLFVISGPEPYAEQFFREVVKQVADKQVPMACLVPAGYADMAHAGHLHVVIASDWQASDQLFHRSETIVSRAGYSTLMDLEVLGKKAVLVPTPGQSEQMYLAKYHGERGKIRFLEVLGVVM